MRVLLVTSWGTAGCGIEEHSRMLIAAVQAADPSIVILPSSEALDPSRVDAIIRDEVYDLVHLNYHGALHSRWTGEAIVRTKITAPVVVTYHDTGVPNSDQCKAVCAAADAFVVHEPYDDLAGNGRYWRMGVPAATPVPLAGFGVASDRHVPSAWRQTPTEARDFCFTQWVGQPVLGSIGFPFPWKNFDLLADITGRLGWALLLIAPTATTDQVVRWETLNPHSRIETRFEPSSVARSLLAGCDATAFPYVCHNTGQSGAILQGIAARKPVYAFSTCRQFRALYADPLGRQTIRWVETVEQLAVGLSHCPIMRVDTATVALAEQDSWRSLGRKYAALYQEVLDGR